MSKPTQNTNAQVSSTVNKHVAKDVFGYSLSYYDDDYNSSNTDFLNHSKGANPNLNAGLYNGNIRSMFTALSNDNEDAMATHQTNYTYDQLNRITSMTGYYQSKGHAVLSGYSSSYGFDANGNLETLKRFAWDGSQSILMDDFVYEYTESINNGHNNRLSGLRDFAGQSQFSHVDIDESMTTDNYEYDEIGQLISDSDEGIDSINWTVTNKVQTIYYGTGKVVHFDYNAMGNRIAKHFRYEDKDISTYYILDAQGNQMAIYTHKTDDPVGSGVKSLYLSERNIYGSSRIGQEKIGEIIASSKSNLVDINTATQNSIGDKFFEMSNHLGNVLEVVTDRKLPVPDGNGNIDYFLADVVSYSDYYPFGMVMPGGDCVGGTADYEEETILLNTDFEDAGDTEGWSTGGPHYMIESDNGKLKMSADDDNDWGVNQYITTEVGKTYTVTFDLDFCGGSPYQIAINAKDETNGTWYYSYITSTPGSHTWTFTATSTNTRIKLLSNYEPGTGNFVSACFDNIKVASYETVMLPCYARSGRTGDYRYGFNGMEKDDKIKGQGNSYDFGARLYDPRVGRWLSVDPQAKKQPDQSPYKAMFNNPIFWVDPDGKTEYQTIVMIDEKSGKKMRMYVAKSGKVMTDGEVTKQQAITNPTRYQRYYDYAHVTTYRFTTDGNIVIEKSTEILYKNKVKHFEDVTLDNLFGATEGYGHVYDPDDSYAQSGGFYMSGSSGQGTKYHSKNADYVGNMDALISILSNYSAGSKITIPSSVKGNSQAWEGIETLMKQMDFQGELIENIHEIIDGVKSEGLGSSKTGNGNAPSTEEYHFITDPKNPSDSIRVGTSSSGEKDYRKPTDYQDGSRTWGIKTDENSN